MLKRLTDRLARVAFLFAAGVSILVVAGIVLLLGKNTFIALKTVPVTQLLFGTNWNPAGYTGASYGTLPLLLSSIMVTTGAMAIAVPWGLLVAVYLSEVATNRQRSWLKPIVELLAAVPSVIYGFLGLVITGPLVARLTGHSSGLNALNASIILAIMILPTIISISDDALKTVPKTYREAARALGATRWQTIWGVVVKAARPGIVASVMLGFGRAVGETMAVLMAAGNAPAMPRSFLDPVRPLTSTIAIELGEVAWNTEHYYVLFALGFYLFLITMVVNLMAEPFVKRIKEAA
ncbi:MAG: phosphate ABC transporter permease subunit PstC [candidate division WOR-3 bacterium]